MSSLRAFLAGIIDYAGLFPPAALEMSSAVHAYAEHRSGNFPPLPVRCFHGTASRGD
jgi:hypothetical protein